MTDLWDTWHGWERGGGPLAAACRQDLHDRVFAFDRRATHAEKADLMQRCTVYPQAACIPFWASEGQDVDDPRIIAVFRDARPEERQAIVRLRVALEQWQAANEVGE
ncbi:hypothetical protein [Paracoccus sp. SSK6]|uniref:hypothetical protein n=1 Tax=Paracoccus sp. SSK6 TaxID=3143131 RepID=UPI00321AA686